MPSARAGTCCCRARTRTEARPSTAGRFRDCRSAVHLDGTLNDPRDADRGWSIELAFPWKVLGELARRPAPPRDGDQWRVNFSRVQWTLESCERHVSQSAGREGAQLGLVAAARHRHAPAGDGGATCSSRRRLRGGRPSSPIPRGRRGAGFSRSTRHNRPTGNVTADSPAASTSWHYPVPPQRRSGRRSFT